MEIGGAEFGGIQDEEFSTRLCRLTSSEIRMSGDLMIEILTLALEAFVLLGLCCMFLADNKGLWVRPMSQGPDDDSFREVSSGK
jgi:hypothetical protein